MLQLQYDEYVLFKWFETRNQLKLTIMLSDILRKEFIFSGLIKFLYRRDKDFLRKVWREEDTKEKEKKIKDKKSNNSVGHK